MKKYRVGIIGYGSRGSGMADVLMECFGDRIEVIAVCDALAERADAAKKRVKELMDNDVPAFTDYREVLSLHPDLAIVMTSWRDHIPVSCAAMEAGVTVACEVGGGNDVRECFRLVETYERTSTPYYFMENCCFGRLEQLALNMKNLGVLGKIVHCEGGYCHDIRGEIACGIANDHYRLSEYASRNCDNYPSHEFLPIAKLLDINRGNRPVSLYSVSSGSVGMKEYIAEKFPDDKVLNAVDFKQGDVVTTVIRFAMGQTLTLTLDTTLPRVYSRKFTVRGTKGSIFEDTRSVFIEGETEPPEGDWSPCWNNIEKYYEKYDSELWKKFSKAPVGSHGGMDYLELRDLFRCLDEDLPMTNDVYDAAFTLAITPLSEQSIITGLPVAVPDFSFGKWVSRYERNK